MQTPFEDGKKWASWGLIAGAMLLASLGISVTTVMLPALTQAFHVSVAAVQWVMLGYLLSVTVLVTWAGSMGDRWGHSQVLAAGLAVFGLASLWCAMASGFGMLVIGRVLQGAGAAVLMALPAAMVRGVADKARVGVSMGVLGSMSAIGTALGPALGGVALGLSGWRTAFGILALLGLLGFALACHVSGRQGGVGSAPARSSQRNTAGWTSVLAQRPMLAGWIMSLVVAMVMMATLVVGPFFLTFGIGLAETQAGLVLAVGPAMAAVAGVLAGRLTDRMGADKALTVGLAYSALGLTCLAYLPRYMGVPGYMLALMVLTPGFQLFLAANNTVLMLKAPQTQQGRVSGLLGLSRQLGLLAGASLMPWLFATLLGEQSLGQATKEQVGQAFTLTFLAAAGVLACLAMVWAWRHVSARHAGRLAYSDRDNVQGGQHQGPDDDGAQP